MCRASFLRALCCAVWAYRANWRLHAHARWHERASYVCPLGQRVWRVRAYMSRRCLASATTAPLCLKRFSVTSPLHMGGCLATCGQSAVPRPHAGCATRILFQASPARGASAASVAGCRLQCRTIPNGWATPIRMVCPSALAAALHGNYIACHRTVYTQTCNWRKAPTVLPAPRVPSPSGLHRPVHTTTCCSPE